MRKIPLFRLGGWLNSYDGAFNQPSSYVGLQYVQKNPDLPPIDGLRKYLEDQEKARKEHEAYRKAASPDQEAFMKMMEKAEGTSGQVNEFSQRYAEWRKNFHDKFKGDDVFSDDARTMLSQINSLFGPSALNQLKQNKQILDEQLDLMKKNEVDGDIWTDGQNILVRDVETGQTDTVPISVYSQVMQDPDLAGKYKALTNRQAYDWKDKNWKFDSPDNFILGDQWSLKKTNEYIDDFFKGMGHKSGGVNQDQFVNIKSFLENQGIDVNTGNVIQQISNKWKNNKEQLAYVQQRIYDSLPATAKKAFISHLVSEGIDPFAKQTIKGSNGQEMEVSNVSQYMTRVVGSASGSKSIEELEQGFGFKSMGSTVGSEEMPQQDVLSLFLNLGGNFEGAKKRTIKSIDGDGKETTAYSIRADHPSMAETFGIMDKAKTVTGGKEIIVDGHRIMVGDDYNSKTGEKVDFVELPKVDNVIVTYKLVTGKNGNPEYKPVYLLERKGVTNMDGLELIGKRMEQQGGKPIFTKGIIGGDPINEGVALIQNLTKGDIKKQFNIPDDDKALDGFGWRSNLHVISYFEEVPEAMLRQGARNNALDRSILGTQVQGIYGNIPNESSKDLATEVASKIK